MRRKFQITLLLNLVPMLVLNSETLSQTQRIESGCGSNIGVVDKSSNVTVNIECSAKIKQHLSFDYSRLFGAFEVPLLMEFIPGRPVKPDISGYRIFVSSRGRQEWIGDSLYNFWRTQLPYKGAVPLLTPMWTDISGNEKAAHSIAWKSSSMLQSERICFYRSGAIDSSGTDYDFLDRHFRFSSEKRCKNSDEFNRRVGFTFLIIENDSDEALTDMKITYRQSYSLNRVKADFHYSFNDRRVIREVSKLPTTRNPVLALTSKYGTAREAEFSLARSVPEIMLVSKVLPRQKLIAIMDVFIANENNLPATYLYGRYVFEDIQYVAGGSLNSVKVRPPSLEKAARIQVPYGWFAQ